MQNEWRTTYSTKASSFNVQAAFGDIIRHSPHVGTAAYHIHSLQASLHTEILRGLGHIGTYMHTSVRAGRGTFPGGETFKAIDRSSPQ